MTSKLWKEFLENDCAVWNLIPKSEKIDELYVLAIQKKCTRLDDVPWRAKSKDVCLAAVQNASSEIIYVPDYRRDDEMFKVIINRCDGMKYYRCINWTPELYKLHLESTKK